jgi:hypothetical protein
MWAVLLVALADLVAPGPKPKAGGGELAVTLEIHDGRYKIVHTWNGAKAMRFITGAADRNCEDPLDVLLVDDKPKQLFSELPCGGFAFRSVRTVQPGGSWTIEGYLSLPEGTHSVNALYAAGEGDVKSIDPKERGKKEPPFWFGRVVSSGLLVDDVIRAQRATKHALEPGAFADLKEVDATSLSAGQRLPVGRVVKKSLLANPHALVRLLVESGQIGTYVHVESELRYADETDSPARYRTKLTGHHVFYTNQRNQQGLTFAVEIDKSSGRIEVIGQ